jgi:hypothetical protein
LLVYAAWTLPSGDAPTMTRLASRAPYNIRVNPTGGLVPVLSIPAAYLPRPRVTLRVRRSEDSR